MSLACEETPTTGFFSQILPTERVSANAVTGRTLRRQVCPRGCCFANAATCSPAVFACLLITSSENGIAPCSVLVQGRATVATAALPWFHQRHRSCAARATLFCVAAFQSSCPVHTTALVVVGELAFWLREIPKAPASKSILSSEYSNDS